MFEFRFTHNTRVCSPNQKYWKTNFIALERKGHLSHIQVGRSELQGSPDCYGEQK